MLRINADQHPRLHFGSQRSDVELLGEIAATLDFAHARDDAAGAVEVSIDAERGAAHRVAELDFAAAVAGAPKR